MTDTPQRRKPIPAEAWRQEKARAFARNAITCDHEFIAHDRSEARGDKSHLFEWARGVKASLPDTQLIVKFPDETVHFWFEWKAKGKVPTDSQFAAHDRLHVLGDMVGWGDTIEKYGRFLDLHLVPLAANWRYQAMQYDAMVDSRIAKAELARDGLAPPKKPRAFKTSPRFTAGKKMARAMHEKRLG